MNGGNHIDLNCDMGEGMPGDTSLMPFISSANIACGLHAGDFEVMARTVEAALTQGVAIGAHPGLPDLAGFGRRAMPMIPEQVRSLVLYQVGALQAIASAAGGRLTHVKPHGALYHMAEADRDIAGAIVDSIAAIDPSLKIVGMSGGVLVQAAKSSGLDALNEVFADRAYRIDGSLVPRGEPGALLDDGDVAASRISDLISTGRMTTRSGDRILLDCDTVCVHGDSERAASFVPQFVDGLARRGVAVRKQHRRE